MQNNTYRIQKPIVGTDDAMLNETLFHNANGYLGVRSCFEEGYPEAVPTIRGCYINGFYDYVDMNQAEKLHGLTERKQTMVNTVDIQGIRLGVNGEAFSLLEDEVLSAHRYLDMEAGVSGRHVRWRSPGGVELEIEIVRMASFARLPLFTIEYRVTPGADCELEFRSSHIGEVENYADPSDPRVAGEICRFILPGEARWDVGGASLITAETSRSGLSLTSAVCHRLSGGGEAAQAVQGPRAEFTAKVGAQAGQRVTLVKAAAICDSLRYPDHREQAPAIAEQALSDGLELLYAEQRRYLARYWDSCAITIRGGGEELEQAVAYNLYQLVQSVSKDGYGNIPAKGLSGEGYEGHYFWDTEMYLLPYFTLTQPQIARSLLHYRYRTLDKARENARIMGHRKGALYPWRTIMGEECSGYFPSGSAQYHINGDIAYAVVQYYLATGDREFLAEWGAEILVETARLWMDAGHFYKGGFHLNDVTGPDEYTCIVNNNYYTNCVARYNLEWAAEVYRLLREEGLSATVEEKTAVTPEEARRFTEAAAAMVLPYDGELGINPQDDSFLQKAVWDIGATPREDFPLLLHYHPLYLYRHQVCKQADTVLAHMILEDYQELETMRRSFAYYERLTTHDSSLSTCIFSIMASRLGLGEKADAYFGESYKLDLCNTHGNTGVGIHAANMGGTYMTIVYGYGGLRIKASGLHLAPALPGGWTGYRFRVNYRGSLIQVEVDAGGSRIEALSGAPEVVVYGRPVSLEAPVHLPLDRDWGAEG